MFLMQTINEARSSPSNSVVVKMSKINVSNCKEYGFDVVADAVEADLINAFCNRYSSAYNPSEPHLSYLPSRDEFQESNEIQNLLSLEIFDNFAKELNKKLVFRLVEARLGSSQIGWHVDNFTEPSIINDSYYSIIIALGDVGVNAGCFEVVSGSHKLNRDLTIINVNNCIADPEGCYKYFDDLLDGPAKTLPIYQFRGQRGDMIIWSGSAIHRGADSPIHGMADKADLTWLRNSLFVHFSLHDSVDMPAPPWQASGIFYKKLEYGDNLYLGTQSLNAGHD